jgi:glutamine---fructose-6-phosphate transaminase (isomerizing)
LAQIADRAIAFETHPQEGIVMTASASLMLLAGGALAGLMVDAALADRAEALLLAVMGTDTQRFHDRSHIVFLGGGAQYGVALEGALKLMEMALCPTQGFHPGEYRHGPVSLVDTEAAFVMLYHDDTRAAEAQLVAELQDKGACVIGFGGPGDISFPVASAGDLAGVEILPALQLLGERHAHARGLDTTAPRHLTKVVVLP